MEFKPGYDLINHGNIYNYGGHHQKAEQRFLSFFDRYTEEEILFAERLFRDLVTKWYPSSEEIEGGLPSIFK